MDNFLLSIPRGKIVGIQFSVMPKEVMIKLHPVKANINQSQQDQFKELDDKALGVVFQEDGECNFCHGTSAVRQNEMPCPGHFGSVALLDTQFIYHPMLIGKLVKILNLFCPECHRLKYRALLKLKAIVDEEQQNEEIKRLKMTSPMYKFLDMMSDEVKEVRCCDTKTVYKAIEECNKIQKTTTQYISKEDQSKPEDVRPKDVIRILELVSDSEYKLIGLENAHPKAMVMQYIPIPPSCIRPNITNMGMVSRDQLTDQYQKLLQMISLNNMEKETQRTNIAQAFRSIIQSSGAGDDDEGFDSKLQGISERLKGKPGRMRMNVMGKRVNYCSRSVISGDPTISIDQLGVPKTVAMRLSFPEIVTERNKQFLEKLVKNGTQYPGANAIERDGEIQKLEGIGQDKISIQVGNIVHRQLLNDDYVMFNRQPSLHKMSFMCHRVKVLPYSTFRLNLCVTKPYNADFDGDEMNFHEPQSYQAITEMAEMMLIPKQIVSCKNNAPLIGIFQDSQVGCFMLTARDKFIEKGDFQKYMMFLEYPQGEAEKGKNPTQYKAGFQFPKEITDVDELYGASEDPFRKINVSTDNQACLCTPQPAILFPKPQWTGKQLFGMSLPDKISLTIGKTEKDSILDDKVAVILNGELIVGVCSSKVIGQAQGGLTHVLWKDFSPDFCKAFLNNCQRTFTQMLIDHGFSIGFGDMVVPESARKEADQLNQKLWDLNSKAIEDSINGKIKLAPGQTNEQGFEGKFQTNIQSIFGDQLIKVVRKVLPKRNAMLVMVDSGSKGKDLNIQQIAICVGQQMLQGNRMVYRFLTNRSLPHFQPYDYGLHSRGYVYHSFIQGLDVQEFFFHMTGGREGVCDTAIKTADSGYVERKMMKNMESISQCYDNSVRNDQNNYVQLRYGEDNLNTHMCEGQTYSAVGATDKEFIKNTFVDFDAQLGKLNLTRTRDNRRASQEIVPLIIFNKLINEYIDWQKLSITDFQYSSRKLREFNVILDQDLVDSGKTVEYMRTHVANLLVDNSDDTPILSNWMNDEAISKLQHSSDFLDLIKFEYLTLLAERYWMQEIQTRVLTVNQQKTTDFAKNTSCDLLRILNNFTLQAVNNKTPLIIADKFPQAQFVDKQVTDLDQITVIKEINKLLAKIRRNKSNESKIFRVLIRQVFNSKQVCFKSRLNQQQFQEILRLIEDKFYKSTGVPGEPVGPLASHSISEPATQLTLNTFHVAGTSALGSLGLPRLKELIDFRETKIPIMTIFIKKNAETSLISKFEDARQRTNLQTRDLMKVAATIENCYFKDFIKQYQVIFDPKEEFEEDGFWLGFGKEIGFYQKPASPFTLRYEIRLQKLMEKEGIISIADIVNTIKRKIPSYDVKYYCGIGQTIIRITSQRPDIKADDLYDLNIRLQTVHICGYDKIKKVFQDNFTPFVHYGLDDYTPKLGMQNCDQAKFGGIYKDNLDIKEGPQKDAKSEKLINELIIRTEGSDLIQVLGMDEVDATKTYCNDLPEVYDVLGVEAARQLLVAEMRNTMPSDNINQRHFALLADVMMCSPTHGKMVSINRHGMRNTNTGVITQASFEQPADAFLTAAAYGLYDNVYAVSSAVAVGSEMRHGTGSFELLLDVKSLEKVEVPETDHPQRLVQKIDNLNPNRKYYYTEAPGPITVGPNFPNVFTLGFVESKSCSMRSTQSGMNATNICGGITVLCKASNIGFVTQVDPYSRPNHITQMGPKNSRTNMSQPHQTTEEDDKGNENEQNENNKKKGEQGEDWL